jgi:ABC-type multidrug transport system ATPase subunit
MDEAERCTDVGFIRRGRLIAKGSPRHLKKGLEGHLLEVHVEPAMLAVLALRKLPEVFGVKSAERPTEIACSGSAGFAESTSSALAVL